MQFELINRSRKAWVDALRGLAILLVIYGHCVKNFHLFFVLTSPFKMPLFFAISGYVFSSTSRNENISVFFLGLIRKIFVPWMFLGLFPALVTIPINGLRHVVDVLLLMISGKYLWFMPCFFVAEIIWFFIQRYIKKNGWVIAAAFLSFTLGFYLHRNGLMNYAMVNRALCVQPFFLIGFLFKRYESRLISIRWSWIVVSAIAYIALCLIGDLFISNKVIDVHLNHYNNIMYNMILIFLSCVLLFTSASKANISSTIMSFVGQNTLVLYIWHGLLIVVTVHALSIVFDYSLPKNWWTALILTVYACVCCGVGAIVLNRFFPFLVGKRRRK